nr:MAG TPA: hypothetical protein [Caudoviricetes sp.]
MSWSTIILPFDLFELPLVQVFFILSCSSYLDNIILHFYKKVNAFFINKLFFQFFY